MTRFSGLSTLVFALGAIACGGNETEQAEAPTDTAAAAPAPAPAAAAADWLRVDDAAKTVAIEVIAGKDATNNSWNFNGYANGNATITVPTGYTVSISFSNNDPNMAHSLGVTEKPAGAWSATPTATPAFAGAMSSNPTSMTDAATKAKPPETIAFTADKAGAFALACFVPGHAAAGMWINFTVADGAAAGVQPM